MNETVSINNLTLCHKNSSGFVRSTLPDVCKSPTVPVPYTNIAFASTLADGTTTVFSHGGAMNGILGSKFATSIGNEPGIGGGVVSGVNMMEATFISFSLNVFMEGRPVTRLTDKMLMNRGNTVSAAGYYTGKFPETPLLTEICILACECAAKKQANQACLDLALTAVHAPTNTPQNGVFPEARYVHVNDKWTLDINPATNMPKTGGGFRRPDVTRLEGGEVKELVEVKFKNNRDRYRGNQKEVYDAIAEDNGVTHVTLDFPNDCNCDYEPPEPVPAPALAPEEESLATRALAFCSEHRGAILAGVIVIAAVAFVVVVGPAAALAAVGALAAAAGSLIPAF